jgi:PleD family two-component response regulator
MMTAECERGSGVERSLRQLRHDLLNPLNVMEGATTALLQSGLSESQCAWVQVLRSAITRLNGVIDGADPVSPAFDQRARLADLCSIAVARIGKPFDRRSLVAAIQNVTGPTRSLRILLVDDSPELAMLVRTYLSGTGWDIDVVENGERAVAQATTAHYDLVLMDVDLPGLDGAAAAHAIRAADLARGASPTPIVAMTAFV